MSIVSWVMTGDLVRYAASHYTTNTHIEAIGQSAAVGLLGAATSTRLREV